MSTWLCVIVAVSTFLVTTGTVHKAKIAKSHQCDARKQIVSDGFYLIRFAYEKDLLPMYSGFICFTHRCTSSKPACYWTSS